jgi:hypothetical protein
MASIPQHVGDLTNLVLPGDRNELIANSDIILSTMTLDGKITNIKFDKVDAINHLELTNRIVEIGCNYGYKILDEYKTWECYKDRMAKKQRRGTQNSSRKQGLGTHFNSQITFTIVSDKDTKNSYQVKLFTNGRVQIPGIGKLSKRNDELLEDLLSAMISYIMSYPTVLLLNKNNPIDIDYLSPILQNYKSKTLMADDCMQETRIVIDQGKRYQLESSIELAKFERYLIAFRSENRTPIPIDSITFNSERYSGMLIKFSTPVMTTGNYKIDKFIELVKLVYHKRAKKSRQAKLLAASEEFNPTSCKCENECEEDCFKTRKMMRVSRMIQNFWYLNGKSTKRFRPKLTTVKLFRSGRINLDHVNTKEQAIIIRKFIVDMIVMHWSDIVFYIEDNQASTNA